MAETTTAPIPAAPVASQPPASAFANPPNLGGFMSSLGSLGTPDTKPAEAVPAAPAPEPEKPAAIAPNTPPPVPPVEEGEDKWPRDSKGWKEFKKSKKEKEDALISERDTIKAEHAKLVAELTELRGKPMVDPEAENVRKENQELSELVRGLKVESHPQFKQYFDGRKAQQIEIAKQIVGAENGDTLAQILSQPASAFRDAQLEELVGNLSNMKQAQVGSVLNQLTQIESERVAAITTERTRWESKLNVENQQNEAAAKLRQQNAEKTFQGAVEAVTDPKEGWVMFQRKSGAEHTEWNASVDARINAAKELLYGKVDARAVAQSALKAVAYEPVLQYAISQAKAVEELKGQIAKLTAAAPAVKTTTQSGGAPENVPIQHKQGLGPLAAIQPWMKSLQDAASRR